MEEVKNISQPAFYVGSLRDAHGDVLEVLGFFGVGVAAFGPLSLVLVHEVE